MNKTSIQKYILKVFILAFFIIYISIGLELKKYILGLIFLFGLNIGLFMTSISYLYFINLW